MSDELWHTLGPHIRTYKLNVNQVVPVNPRQLRLEGRSGSFEASVTSLNEAKARRLVADWAAQQGVRRISRHLQNMYEERERNIGGGKVVYIANRWRGVHLDVNRDDALAAAENLALLHNAMDGCQTLLDEVDDDLDYRHGQWQERLRAAQQQFHWDRHPRLATFAVASRQQWVDWVGRWADLAGTATEQLARWNYEEWAQTAKQADTVAWNGYHLHTVTRLEDQELAVNQAMTPVRDSVLYDLAALCADIVTSGRAEDVVETIEAYALHRQIDDRDRAIVLCFAAFPHQGLGMLHSVSRGRLSPGPETKWQEDARRQYTAAKKLLLQVSG